MAVDCAKSAGVGNNGNAWTCGAAARPKAAQHVEIATGNFLFDDRATIGRFYASFSDPLEVSFLYPLTIDGFPSLPLGSARVRGCELVDHRNLK